MKRGGALAAAGALATLAAPAAAQQVLLEVPAARVSLEPIAADASLGGRAQLAASLGAFDTSLTAAFERGGGQLSAVDAAWVTVIRPASWTSDDVQLAARWATFGGAQLSLEAGNRERRTRNFIDPLAYSADQQLAVDQSRFLRLRLAAQAGPTALQAGAETSTNALDTLNPGEPSDGGTRLWVTSRRLFARLAWQPSPHISFEAGQAAQTFNVGWRGADALQSQAAYLTPDVALVLTPSPSMLWRLDLEESVTPVDPAKFAAYAQLATPGGGAAPQPDRGWRYGLSLEQQLPGGVKLSARATRWRLASVTDLGPVGASEAPVGIGQGARRQLDVNLAAPLAAVGLPGAILAGEVSWRRSQVYDPFTGARRPISGETPYRAQLQLSGALPTSPLSWSLIAKADGPQNLYQMSKVTNLGATSGLDGAVRYDAGRLRISLELDNLVGGSRQVTTYTWSGSRADGSPDLVERRGDDARAVRISLRRGL
ncbi:hypothetical protein LJR225_001768 [Phenylobacterium sp. LjRoot225]|uniref:hypothetical protein n=1 Tax=Phenylobacterium sp. LjRoot225 TaxID=3342285 RepID=UPI003ECF6603